MGSDVMMVLFTLLLASMVADNNVLAGTDRREELIIPGVITCVFRIDKSHLQAASVDFGVILNVPNRRERGEILSLFLRQGSIIITVVTFFSRPAFFVCPFSCFLLMCPLQTIPKLFFASLKLYDNNGGKASFLDT